MMETFDLFSYASDDSNSLTSNSANNHRKNWQPQAPNYDCVICHFFSRSVSFLPTFFPCRILMLSLLLSRYTYTIQPSPISGIPFLRNVYICLPHRYLNHTNQSISHEVSIMLCCPFAEVLHCSCTFAQTGWMCLPEHLFLLIFFVFCIVVVASLSSSPNGLDCDTHFFPCGTHCSPDYICLLHSTQLHPSFHHLFRWSF